MTRGALIVFEGLDRCGKSTQCLQLTESLRKQGHDVLHLRFPNRATPIGGMIDGYLSGQSEQDDHAIHLLFSANRWESAQLIENTMAQGVHVVVDRYYYSGVVYSAAKNNPSLSLQWCRQQEVGLPRPDICLFLQLSPAEAASRGGYGEERYEREEMQQRVRTLFDELRLHDDEKEDMIVVDAGKPIETLASSIYDVVQAAINRSINTPLRHVQPWS